MTDKEIELVVIKAVKAAFKEFDIDKKIKDAFDQHIASCPIGKKVNTTIAWVAGASATIGFVVAIIIKG